MILIVMTTRTRTAMFWWLELDHLVYPQRLQLQGAELE